MKYYFWERFPKPQIQDHFITVHFTLKWEQFNSMMSVLIGVFLIIFKKDVIIK